MIPLIDRILQEQSKELAKEIVFLCRDINASANDSALTDQLFRAGTSIGAILHLAKYAQEEKELIAKLESAREECYRTEYWLDLLFETNDVPHGTYTRLKNRCEQIGKTLISAIGAAKAYQSKR